MTNVKHVDLWKDFKEKMIKEYIALNDGEHEVEQQRIGEKLQYMDEKDGTNDFANIKDDLNYFK